MPYVVLIDEVGRNGLPMGQPKIQDVGSEEEGLAIMQSSAEQAPCRMVYSLYDHDKRMIFSYTSKSWSSIPFGATPI